MLRKPRNNITRQALTWIPGGKRKRGRPKNTWRRGVEGEIKGGGWKWGEVEGMAQDRQRWISFVDGLCSSEEP